jgi:hypothetical protein
MTKDRVVNVHRVRKAGMIAFTAIINERLGAFEFHRFGQNGRFE